MNLEEELNLFRNQESLFSLPFKVDYAKDVQDKLYEKLSDYTAFVESLDLALSERAKNIVLCIKNALDLYLNGKPSDAFNEICKLFILNRKLKKELLIDKIEKLVFQTENSQLYKARKGMFSPYLREQMFHIPYNLREKIENQRYSIMGFPCVYLGGSPYICWEELDRPDFNKFNVSRYEVANGTQMLHLGHVFQDVADAHRFKMFSGDNAPDFLHKYILTFPLQLACSIKVIQDSKRDFRIEYVIPQLVMQAMVKNEISGVIYFSTKGDYSKQFPSPTLLNYAFPASRTPDDATYSSHLASFLKMTNPINMGMWLNIPISEAKHGIQTVILANYRNNSNLVDNTLRRNNLLFLNDDLYFKYAESVFYQFEKTLKLYECKKPSID